MHSCMCHSSLPHKQMQLMPIEKCIADVRNWMVSNRLFINDSKTEFMIIGSGKQLAKISMDIVTVGDAMIKPHYMMFRNTEQQRLHRVLNTAACFICRLPKYLHTSPVLKDLHWLTIKYRVIFKFILLVFKVLHGLAPSNLENLIRVKLEGRYYLKTKISCWFQKLNTKRLETGLTSNTDPNCGTVYLTILDK